MTIRIAVLGCGPAGLLAAHAVALVGFEPMIYSRKKKSFLGGAQYLHRSIPGITPEDPEGHLEYRMVGDEETYTQKVYGAGPDVPISSWRNYEGRDAEPAWDIRSAYDRLWGEYEKSVVNVPSITPETVREILRMGHTDMIANTIPAPYLCEAKANPRVKEFHFFNSQEVRVNESPMHGPEDNLIVYDGTDDRSWYRSSKIFGVGGTEWSTKGRKPPLPDIKTIRKPIGTNCDCWNGLIRLGRHGHWHKTVLSHHAFVEMAVHLWRNFEKRVPGVDVEYEETMVG